MSPICGYKTLSTNIPIFKSHNALPLHINIQRLDEGNGIEQTLIDNSAKYHHSCRLLFKDSKLAYIQNKTESEKRKASLCFLEVSDSPRIKRNPSEMHCLICFICEKEDTISNLNQFEQLNACVKVREMATELCDEHLLKYVSGADAIAQELKYHKR